MTDENDLVVEPASMAMLDGISPMAGMDDASGEDGFEAVSASSQHVAAGGLAVQIPDLSVGHENETQNAMAPHANPSTFPSGSLLQIPITVKVILGSAKLTLGKMASLGPGSVLTLDQKLSEPVILMANGNQIAKGLLVVLNDESGEIGISLTEIIGGLSDENLSA